MNRTIIHFEIPANDVEKLAGFYRDLFGWKIEKSEMPEYWMMRRRLRARVSTAE